MGKEAQGIRPHSGRTSSQAIRLGLMAPLTGSASMYGHEISQVGQMAVEEINEGGGVLGTPLELIIADDGSLPETAVSAATKLVELEGCSALIGNILTNVRTAVAYRVAEILHIPYLNFSYYDGSISSRYFYHFASLPNQQVEKMIPYMVQKFGRNIFFAGSNDEWSRGSIDSARAALEACNGEMIGVEYLPLGSDPSELLSKLAKSEADVLASFFVDSDQLRILSEFTRLGLKSRMAVVVGHGNETMMGNLPAEVREGCYSSSSYFMSIASEENERFLNRLSKYPEVAGTWPVGNGVVTHFGEGTYLCIHAFTKAVKEAGSLESEKLRECLEEVKIQAPQGRLEMDAELHHAKVNNYLARCERNGSFTIVKAFGQIKARIASGSCQTEMSLSEEWKTAQANRIAKVGIAYASLSGFIFHVSPSFARLVGKEPAQLISENLLRLTHPRNDHSQTVDMELLLGKLTQDGMHLVRRVRQGGGAQYRLNFKIMNALGPEGKPVSLILKAWQDESGQLFPSSWKAPIQSVACASLDTEDRLAFANESFLKLWGYTDPTATLGRHIGHFFTDTDQLKQALQSASQSSWLGELTAKRIDGQTQNLEVSVEVLFSSKHRLLGSVLTCLEIQSNPPTEDLGSCQAVSDMANFAMVACDMEGKIIQANQSAGDLFGYDLREMIGLSIQFLLPPRFRERHKIQLLQFGNTAQDQDAQREVIGYRKDCSEFPLIATISKFLGPTGPILIATICDISEQKKAELLLSWQATHDGLTSLQNRTLLLDRLNNALKRAQRSGQELALLFIDLDGFKLINDNFGHETGDQLLISISDRLLESVRLGDTVSRFGGDEFVILCEQVVGPQALSSLLERLITSIKQPIQLGSQQHFITPSIGVVQSNGRQDSAESLLRKADTTMYLVKERGRNGWRIFNDDIDKKARLEMEIATGLRLALERNEIEANFQPIVHTDGEIVGVELLMRWCKEGQMIPPSQFIPVAERTGSILELGRWIFEKACFAQVNIKRRFPSSNIYLSVNLSARQMNEAALAEYFQQCLLRTGADANYLLLEITETALMHDVETNLNQLKRFGELGLALAVDNFGTGYSSLNQLTQLPVDSLKIDKLFIQGLGKDSNKSSIVNAIVKMTQALGLEVVAEGVETETQLAELKQLQCMKIQGFYFYKPMSFKKLIELLEKSAMDPPNFS